MRTLRIIPVLGSLFACILCVSCENPAGEPDRQNQEFRRGVFIVNEGQFLASNASISFFDPVSASVQNHVFYRANQVPLGDVAHSMIIHGDQAFIVVNNSGKVYRTRAGDMEFLGKITGLVSPRYIVLQETSTTGTIAYISDLYSGTITLADPVQGSVVDSIPIRKGSERRSSENLILHGDKLYVTCWSFGRQVLVIDTRTHRLIDSIEVGKQPNSMLMDPRGYLWVLSDGGYPFSPYGQEKASLTRIHPGNHFPERMKTWSDIGVSPTDLCINKGGDSLYFIAGDIYKVSTDMEGFNKPLIPAGERQFYSLGIDPSDGTIYAGDAVDYQQDGWVYRFSSGGVPIDSFRVGVNPGHFSFFDPAQQ